MASWSFALPKKTNKMRQHVLRHKEQIIEENKKYIVSDPTEMKGKWHSLFCEGPGFDCPDLSALPLFVEVGSGKGQFITQTALAHPDRIFLACEGAVNVYPRILQKAGAMKLPNLRVISKYIIDPADCFDPGELQGVYINFCDPWPKDRYSHRRLTHVSKLLSYKRILSPGATLEFKTDNDELFDFSLEQLKLAGLEASIIERDLHGSSLAADNIETEYEQKFAQTGKTINYLKIVF